MRLDSIPGNTQRLDGGAMFGNCPKALWSRWCPPDEENRIDLACRCLLVREASGRTILFEAGIGAFFEPKMRARFGVVEDEHVLLRELRSLGVEAADVDVIVLSHLHFDHAGGLLRPWAEGAAPALAFPNAAYVIGEGAWGRAATPHPRDRASFIPGLLELLDGTGRVERVRGRASTTLGEGYSFTFSEGHTPGLMLTRIAGGPAGPITFMGDLIPGVPWVHLPITMGYDRFPELLIDEKAALLGELVAGEEWAFFTHDAAIAAARIATDERGRYHAADPQAAIHWG
ncbi:MAG: MBL fold metallo-hydrolase [Myxococcales bacterium]|nr:MBL fold metallo-hydrolase [Myxococcales bacterium]